RREMETAAATMAVTLIPVETRTPEDLDPVFPALARERVDVVIALRDPLFFTRRRTLTAAALASRLPTIYAWREPVDDGGLISYGIDVSQNSRRAADYVVKILKGAKPGDLPVEFPTKLELVINLPTAKALGVIVPPSLRFLSEVRVAASAVGQQLIVLDGSSAREIETAFVTLVQRGAGALHVGGGMLSQRERIIALAARHGIPAIYVLREYVTAGGLMSYGTSMSDAYRQAGIYAG